MTIVHTRCSDKHQYNGEIGTWETRCPEGGTKNFPLQSDCTLMLYTSARVVIIHHFDT